MVLEHLNWLDYVLLSIGLISLIIGIIRGLAREVISVLTWIVAFAVSVFFADTLALALGKFIKSTDVAQLTSFILLFVLVLIIGGLINYIVGRVIDHSGLSFTNRMGGLIFGLLRAALIILFIVFIITNTALQEKDFFKHSKVTYWFQDVSVWMTDRIIKMTKEPGEFVKETIHQRFGGLKEASERRMKGLIDK